MKIGRKEGKSPKRVEIERAQILKSEGIKQEREKLRRAVSIVSKVSKAISLGIMSETGTLALDILKLWINHLELPHGKLHGTDESGAEISVDSMMSIPVYLKYNSSDPYNAYMKPYKSDGFVGVIFQPVLDDLLFRQYGDLPLKLF
jgi:hypothetical protein